MKYLFGQESVDGAFLRREVDAYGYQFAAVGSVGFGVALVLDLPEGCLGRTIELELDDIDVARTSTSRRRSSPSR